MTDYGVDARERHNFAGRLRAVTDSSDCVIELTPEQQRVVAPHLARLPADGNGIALAQVFDGGYEDELPAEKGGPRVFVCLRVLTGERALRLQAATIAAMKATPE